MSRESIWDQRIKLLIWQTVMIVRFIKTDYMDVNAKSIINLISGTFRHGDVVQCVCNGPDEEEALAAMKRILSENLEE